MAQQYSQKFDSYPKPFLKWAGGKRQLMSELQKHFPTKISKYHEPFLGGGAVLFDILQYFPQAKSYVSDLNAELILAYVTIRDNVENLIESLKDHEKNYLQDSKTYYYSVRQNSPTSSIGKVSRLLFLNKTCFNGLYRVNSKGKFNVPLGSYAKPNIVNEENLRSVSTLFNSRNIKFTCRDFASILDDVKKDDFVYFDPPYQPISSTANFTSYTNKDFTTNDLKRLVDLSESLDAKGCNVLLSNSFSSHVMDQFSSSIWSKIKISANRAINSNSTKRTGHFELLIKNY